MKFLYSMSIQFETNVQYLKGVGPKLGALLEKRGIKTVGDLIDFYPRVYEDRRAARLIRTLQENETVSLQAQIFSVSSFRMGKSYKTMHEITLSDSSGRIPCKFFRIPFKGYFDQFQKGQMVRVIGKVTSFRGRLQFQHPELKVLNEEEEMGGDQLIPIYTELEGLSTSKIQKLIQTALNSIETWVEKFPESVLKKYNLLDRHAALKQIHEPSPVQAELYHQFRAPSQRRIIFEDFFWLELIMAAKRSGFKKDHAPVIHNLSTQLQKFIQSLPYRPTQSQMRVMEEIIKDLQLGAPMHRMIQGDVGSGKTLVSLMSAVYVAESGYQSCLMVPTEILAEQHAMSAGKFLNPLGLKVSLLTGKMKASERKKILENLREGKTHLLIGTHALIENDVEFKNLGLVVIDEQHRFGVEQRAKLKTKGASPHFLVMTATPIPRTLAMTVYGDLDVSIINEMPQGRSPIQTRVVYESKRPEVMKFMLDQLAKSRQVYIVYPLVEESEKIDLKDAVSAFSEFQEEFPQINFGLLHGKMSADEKESVMEEFRKNKIQVLIATTVIEVGVDVPNANLMIIQHAERFGLSQLHQLRGRVGRGEHKSFCVLMLGRAVSEESKTRVDIMEKTTDGFKISEFDLELRGPGEFLGTRQSGLTGFKMANLVRDMEILQEAKQAAFEIIQSDASLDKPEHIQLRLELLKTHGPMALTQSG